MKRITGTTWLYIFGFLLLVIVIVYAGLSNGSPKYQLLGTPEATFTAPSTIDATRQVAWCKNNVPQFIPAGWYITKQPTVLRNPACESASDGRWVGACPCDDNVLAIIATNGTALFYGVKIGRAHV